MITRFMPGVKTPIRAVLFDMDGVVLDTEKLYARFWREAAIALGYPMTHQQALGMRSLNSKAGQAQLESYFGPGVSRAAIREKRVELMDSYIADHGVDAMPGIHETLQWLRQQGIRTAIATSSPLDRAMQYLRPLGLLDQFDEVCSAYGLPNGKPAPDVYLLAAERIGVSPEYCLAVEDSPAGILSAYRAGCMPVFIPDQDDADEETKSMLYAKIERLPEIIALIKEEQL